MFSFPGVKKVSVLVSYLCYKTIKSGSNHLGNSRQCLMISSFIHIIIHFFIKYFLTCYDVPECAVYLAAEDSLV